MPNSLPIYTDIPQVGNGYPINGEWEVLVPIARTNEVLNPSPALNTAGYTAGAGVLARSSTKQFHGVYSLSYTPTAAVTDGFFYGTITTTAAQFRAISCKFLGQPNVPYVLTFATNAGVDLVKYEFKGTGRWQWIWLYYMETSSTTRRIYFRKNNSSDTHVFYVDGVQSEVINTGEFVSTYIDGSQQGFLPNQSPPPYGWNGPPYASSSYRTILTRAGGYVFPFKRAGFLMLAIIGLGLPQVQNVSTEYAVIDGGYPSYSRKPTGQFSIVGNLAGWTDAALRSNRSQLGRYLDRDAVGIDQTLLLRYRHLDSCDNVVSDTVEIACKYVTGLDGSVDNMASQKVPLTFESYLPNIQSSGRAAATLQTQQTLTWSQVIQRSGAGIWSNLNGGSAGGIIRVVWYQQSTGYLYAGGDFTTIGGVAANRIAYFNPATNAWTAMGTGLNDTPYGMDEDAAGNVYVAGQFTSAGGVANTSRVAKWTTAGAWASITPAGAANALLTGVKRAPDNTMVFTGNFTLINTVAINFVAKFTIATGVWSAAYGGGPGGTVTAKVLALSFNGSNPYVVATIGGLSVLKYWNGSAWTTLATGGVTDAFDCVIMGLNGLLYVGGSFATISGVAAKSVAYYNGVSFFPLGLGLYDTAALSNATVAALAQYPNGNIVAVGNFDTTGTAVVLSNAATWDGGAWSSRDIALYAGGGMNNVATRADGALAMSGDGSPSSIAGQTSLTVSGTARAFPLVTVRGPSSGVSYLYLIANLTTGRNVFLNLPISTGEIDTFDFQPDDIQFRSSVNGNLESTILPGSDESDFFLSPGVTNVIAIYAINSTMTADIQYTPAYLSLDDVT